MTFGRTFNTKIGVPAFFEALTAKLDIRLSAVFPAQLFMKQSDPTLIWLVKSDPTLIWLVKSDPTLHGKDRSERGQFLDPGLLLSVLPIYPQLVLLAFPHAKSSIVLKMGLRLPSRGH